LTEGAPAPTELRFADTRLFRELLGQHDEHVKTLERHVGVRIDVSDSTLTLSGDPVETELVSRVLLQLYGLLENGYPIYPSDVDYALRILSSDRSAKLRDIFLDTVFISAHKRVITPKSIAQKGYIDAIRNFDIVFGIGPAGTGKTYLAMAMAIAELMKNNFSRIILTRPAVEAGEKLGFLPGDLAEKVNPYLRPLYDALHDMVDFDRARRLVERGTIEVAPLAFMRGRTLNDSFVILDEAQNTTTEQMKMFLTRLGYGSKAVVTGDVTQVDLPAGKASGLKEAQAILRNIPGIRFVTFTERDVAELSIVLVSDGEMQRLNRRWRRKDRPTDVLSFPLDAGGLLGDVVISVDTARRQAAEQGTTLGREADRLLIHGLLHLLGYDHERSPAEARRMQRRERALARWL
jgi:phosphate starvation-inducible PhoH-like protein